MPEMTGMVGNCWKWLEVAGSGCKWLDWLKISENGWTLLENAVINLEDALVLLHPLLSCKCLFLSLLLQTGLTVAGNMDGGAALMTM